ncbi:hypothetical protein E4A51_05955 [Cellulomonas sp. HD19AZ1]|nr:hypothetical protein E4A51_05955 [Cellulomonas sp. HD19AZ1]
MQPSPLDPSRTRPRGRPPKAAS